MRRIALPLGFALLSATGCTRNASMVRDADKALAAPRAGVYLTADDFEQGRLGDTVACKSARSPIARTAFVHTKYVELSPPNHAASPRRYLSAEIFGFRACDGSDVRLVSGESYRIKGATPLMLYERERLESQGKGGTRLVYDHFFSTSAADSVRPLSMRSLKRAYPTNHRFHDLLELAFRNDAELMRYDEFHQEYVLARILRQTLP